MKNMTPCASKPITLKWLVLLTCSLMLAGCASSQRIATDYLPHNIQFPYDGISPGYSFVQQVTGPGVTREVRWEFTGLQDGLYQWDLFLNNYPNQPHWQTQWLTKNGALVKYTQSDTTAKWYPHNCYRTLGECQFSYTDPYGFTNEYVRTGSFDGKQWLYELYRIDGGERKLFTSGSVRFDQRGTEIYHESYTSNNGHQIAKLLEYL